MSTILPYQSDGEGEPLLLLNGGLMTIASWQPLAASLFGSYRVLRCDFRGQLLSPGQGHPSLAGHVDDLVALLDDLGLSSVHLFGASFGGEVALLMAARQPARVRSLVILTATDRITDEMFEGSEALIALAEQAAAGGDGGEVFRAVAASTFGESWLASQPSDLIELRAAQFARLPVAYFEGLIELMRALQALDLTRELALVACPTLVIGAEQDRVFPVEHSRALAGAIPRADLVVLEGVGHGAILEATGRVFEEMRSFHARLHTRGHDETVSDGTP